MSLTLRPLRQKISIIQTSSGCVQKFTFANVSLFRPLRAAGMNNASSSCKMLLMSRHPHTINIWGFLNILLKLCKMLLMSRHPHTIPICFFLNILLKLCSLMFVGIKFQTSQYVSDPENRMAKINQKFYKDIQGRTPGDVTTGSLEPPTPSTVKGRNYLNLCRGRKLARVGYE